MAAKFVGTLAISIAYNFFAISGIEYSAFYVVLGNLQQITFLGTGFNDYVYPSLLLLMCLLTLTNCWGRFLNCLGKKQFDFDPEFAEEMIKEGIILTEEYKRE